MERVKMSETAECMFCSEESDRIDAVVQGLVSFLKEKNLTFAEAVEALLRCKVLIGNEKIS